MNKHTIDHQKAVETLITSKMYINTTHCSHIFGHRVGVTPDRGLLYKVKLPQSLNV
jgi:hypothetical protein